MANILDKIIAVKKLEVDEAKAKLPLKELIENIDSLPHCRNFAKAVTKKNKRGINVIAEVKKASPSAGIIREDFDPVAIAKIYESCSADAISVLTDEKHFQGKLEYLKQVKAAVKCPVLRKDFIIDPYQIYEARMAGADAILLIAEALTPSMLIDLMILAHKLTLSCLVEVHSMDSLLSIKDMINVPSKTYTVLGVNNRDLTTMQVDINNTSRMAEFVDKKSHLISESGIKTRQDVEKLIKLGVGGILIGQTLCESPDISAKFKELFG